MIAANTVRELFEAARIFCVPNYQRAYTWEKNEQVRTFLDDIRNQHPLRPFPLGTLLLEEGERENDHLKVYIVDGQQRLTTLIIFISAVVAKLEQSEKFNDTDGRIKRTRHIYLVDQISNVTKFRTITMDITFFESHILNENPLPSKFFGTPSQRRLWNAKAFFIKKLDNISEEECIKLLDIIDNAKILVDSVDNPGEATQKFEFQNDRGKPLTNLESIKSFLMHNIYLGAVGNEVQTLQNIQLHFENIYRKCEELDDIDGRVSEDNILNYHCIAFEGAKGSAKDFVKKTVRCLVKEDNVKAVGWIKKFSRELEDSFNITLELLKYRDNLDIFADLYILDRMAHCYPLLIKTYKLDSENKTKFKKIARLMEIFILRSYGIVGLKAQIKDYANSWAYNFSGDFDNLIVSLKEATTWWSLNKRFENGLKNIYFYGYGKYAKYLLWKYENHLRSQTGSHYTKISWRDFLNNDSKEKLSIEHIASQSSDDIEYSLATKEGDSKDFRENYLHKLGNLVLDSHSPNASKGKNPFPIKKAKYATAPLMSQNELSSFVVTRNDDGTNVWDEKAIDKRCEEIFSFALNYWNVENI